MPNGKSPLLQADLMAEADTQKYVLFNDAVVGLEDSLNRSIDIDMSAGNRTLSESEFLRYGVVKVSGQTGPVTLTVPTEIGSDNIITNRVFAVRNEGNNTVTVTHGGAGDTLLLNPGDGSYFHADGVDIFALGAGAVLGTVSVKGEGTDIVVALSELDFYGELVAVTDGGSGRAIVTVSTPDFIDLGDVPNDYTGEAGKVIGVNAAEDGLEFLAGLTTNFLALTDTPSDFTGEAGKFIAINSGEDGLEFVTFSQTFTSLSDTPSAFLGQAGKVVSVNAAEDALEYSDATTDTSTFAALTDTPLDYTGQAGKIVAVNTAEDAVEYIDAPTSGTSSTTFEALTDTPIDYVGQAGKFVAVNTAEDAVEFVAPPSQPDPTYDTITADYTLVDADFAGDVVKLVDSTADVTLTVGAGISNTHPCTIIGIGTGLVIFVGASGVTVNAPDGRDRLRVRHSSASLFRPVANTFQIAGDIVTA